MAPQVPTQLTKAEPGVGLVASWLACGTLVLGAQPFSPDVQPPPRSWIEGQQGSSLLLELRVSEQVFPVALEGHSCSYSTL